MSACLRVCSQTTILMNAVYTTESRSLQRATGRELPLEGGDTDETRREETREEVDGGESIIRSWCGVN